MKMPKRDVPARARADTAKQIFDEIIKGIGPAQHLQELGIATIVDLPVGERLKDHPFFFNVYALKREVNAMKPAAGALVWTRSQSAQPSDLDLHISATHYFDPNASPTGGAIVLACAVTL